MGGWALLLTRPPACPMIVNGWARQWVGGMEGRATPLNPRFCPLKPRQTPLNRFGGRMGLGGGNEGNATPITPTPPRHWPSGHAHPPGGRKKSLFLRFGAVFFFLLARRQTTYGRRQKFQFFFNSPNRGPIFYAGIIFRRFFFKIERGSKTWRREQSSSSLH
jgi:hypothetical protein